MSKVPTQTSPPHYLMKFVPSKPSLLGESLDSLTAQLSTQGHPAFRAKQILEWLYKKFQPNPDHWTNLPAPLRQWIKESYTILPSQCILVKGDPDTTQKLLLKLEDNSLIETVLLRAPRNNEDDPADAGDDDSPTASSGQTFQTTHSGSSRGIIQRKTVCISTQVGCAYGCKFCASGLAGWKRDLTVGEIVSELYQIILMEGVRATDQGAGLPFDNIVVMGMGEPLANFENLIAALTHINADWGFKFGARRITVSTSGVVPKIKELAELPTQFRLAISLHGATNEVRNQIMPVNKKYPLEELIPAARYYNQRHNRMLTFEYILINELNDTFEQADALIKICEGMKVHINCIPYNTVEGLSWTRPSLTRQLAFVQRLEAAGVSVTIRREKGHTIDAACGQLRLQQERKQGTL